jgi:hypothetical protein
MTKQGNQASLLEHRAAVEEKRVQQEADLSRLPRQSRPAVEPAVGLRRQQATTIEPQPSPDPAPQEGSAAVPDLVPASAEDAPPDPGTGQSTFANRFSFCHQV